ncbi:MAG TPA: glycosyltransferase family 1 protein [Acidimicrobiaceae bacterium]|nr:glycosyltransferase family 1 protein [Acidimicrobiaceae bacterium]
MRVALVCPYSLSAPGGVQGQVLGLARALRRAGHEAVVLAPVDSPLPDTRLPAGAVVALGRTVPVPANGSVARLAVNPLAAGRVVGALRRLRPAVVHLHEPLAPGPTWAAMARPEPKVGTFHRAGDVKGVRLLAPAARLLGSRLAARTAVSEQARHTAQRLVGGDYVLVGNGVELDRFATAQPWPTEGPTVVFVGRHEPRKGLDVLLDAFGQLDPALGARLWVAGEGPETAGLKHRFGASGGVEWLGRVDDDELARRMVAATALCAPSRFGESFGVVLLEAMAARAVVVASDIPGYAAVVGSHGVLVPPGDAAALAGALGTVLAPGASGGVGSPAFLQAAAAHGRHWSMDAVAERYLEVYRATLDTGPAPAAP